MSDDRVSLTVRLNQAQYEALRRRCLAEGLTQQLVLSAAVNSFVLGDLKVRPNGRYFVSAPNAPLTRDDRVTLRAPTTEDPERTIVIEQAPANGRRRLGSTWLVDHVEQRSGRRVSPRQLRRFLAHLEETGRVEEREGRYWSFTGPEDPQVVATMIALDDGTYSEWSQDRLEQVKGLAAD